MRRRPRITLLRLMAASAATAPVFALLASVGVHPGAGLAPSLLAAGATAGIVLLAPSVWDAIAALLAVAVGIFFGLPLTMEACTGLGGPILGVSVGLFFHIALRRVVRWYIRPFRSCLGDAPTYIWPTRLE